MKKIMTLALLISTVFAYGKRSAPEEVSPISYNGKKYIVNHWSKGSEHKQNGGIIEVWNIKTNKLIKAVMIYKIQYDLSLERDVQDVFITSISLNKKNKMIVILNEKGYKYYMDLKSYSGKFSG